MVIISTTRLREAAKKHGDCDVQLRTWEKVTKDASWKNANDVKAAFPFVSVLKNNRFCFNIKGNDYRLVTFIRFGTRTVYIRFIDTHAKYDRIDANTI